MVSTTRFSKPGPYPPNAVGWATPCFPRDRREADPSILLGLPRPDRLPGRSAGQPHRVGRLGRDERTRAARDSPPSTRCHILEGRTRERCPLSAALGDCDVSHAARGRHRAWVGNQCTNSQMRRAQAPGRSGAGFRPSRPRTTSGALRLVDVAFFDVIAGRFRCGLSLQHGDPDQDRREQGVAEGHLRCSRPATWSACSRPTQDSAAPTAAAIAALINCFSRMKVTMAPKHDAGQRRALTEDVQSVVHQTRRCSAPPRPAWAAVVPAAASALSISPAPQAARLGMIAATTAAACRRGVDWNACAPISSPM